MSPHFTKEAEALLRGLAERIHHDCPPPILEARAFLDAMKGEPETQGGAIPFRITDESGNVVRGGLAPIVGCVAHIPPASPEPKADERTVGCSCCRDKSAEELIQGVADRAKAKGIHGYAHDLHAALAAHRAEVEAAEQHVSILRKQLDEQSRLWHEMGAVADELRDRIVAARRYLKKYMANFPSWRHAPQLLGILEATTPESKEGQK